MKNKTTISIIILIILGLGIWYFTNKDTVDPTPNDPNQNTVLGSTDAVFDESHDYLCENEEFIGVLVGDGIARLTLSDQRVFTLEKVTTEDESEVKYTNENNQIALWVKDDSAFVEENGVSIYDACRLLEK